MRKTVTLLPVQQRRARVKELTEAGFTLREISEELGVSRQTIKTDRDKLGVERTVRAIPPEIEEKLEKAAQLREEGVALVTIAEELEISVERVRAHLQEHHPKLAQPLSSIPNGRKARVLALLKKGYEVTAIAESEGVTPPSISRWKRILIEEGRFKER